MTGFDSKRTAALDKLTEVTEEMGLYKEPVSKDKALKLALEALDSKYVVGCSEWRGQQLKALAAIKEALAQPAQEPVAMRYDYDGYGYKYIDSGSGSDWQTRIKDAEPIYTTPPQRPWVELTDEEIQELRYKIDSTAHWTYDEFARYIETKLKEKNT